MTISLESIPSYAVHNLSRNPDDPYQVVTETAAWDWLNRLELWSAEDVSTLIGTACKGPVRHGRKARRRRKAWHR